MTKVRMTTTAGDMVIELHTDELPITTGSFLSLIDEGHYNGLHFHRVISGFMIQGALTVAIRTADVQGQVGRNRIPASPRPMGRK